MGERCGTCDSTLVKFGGYGKQCGVCGHPWMPRIDPKPPAATESDTSGGGEKKCELGCILEAPHTGTSCRGSFDPHNVGVLGAKAKADAKAATEERGEPESEHTSWCRSNELDLCSGCSVKKGWDRTGVTGEPTTCRDGVPHEWPPRPCNCGPNDKRKGDRRFTHPPAPSDGLRENVVRCKAVSRETGRQCVRFAGSGAGICEVHRRGDATGLIDADHSREQLDDGLREALEEIKALEPILSLPHDQQSVVRLLNKVWKIARTALDKGKTDD